ncbi:MAG TPA: cytochrome ubiquinol oxidase subunit I [Candidatus Dormibacteraeota bacterium]|jgi:hypothetical protein|nr:cytochrome ubiquinol oxidase subunit I [Candidatus Dormibacteraeota bacterium]
MPAPLQGGGFSLNLPNVHFPVLGAMAWVGLIFLLHIIIAAWSMGVVILAPTYELIGKVTGDERLDRYARSLTKVNIRLFSLGAVLGSFAVFSLTGLYPNLFIRLVILFFLPVLYAFLSWFVTIAAELVYYYRWDAWAAAHKWRHIAVGYVAGIVEQSFLFFIVGLDSYMMTPGRGIGPGIFFNASYWPELLHRFVGNLSYASFLIALVMVVLGARRWESKDAPYYRWAAGLSMVVGFVMLLPQAVIGFVFADSIRQASPAAFAYSFTGPMDWMWIVQLGFLGIVLLGTNVYFGQTRTTRSALGPLLTGAVVVCSVVALLPEQLYPRPLFWVRYIFLGLSLLLTLAHCLIWRPWLRGVRRPDLNRLGRWSVGMVGITAVLLFMLMGVIRETTKGAGDGYAVYGEETQSQGQNMFKAPDGGFFP